MKVAVIGTGYVGLVAGACLAETGNDVICVDINKQRIADLNNGQIPIYEPGLTELVQRNHQKGRLNFTTNTAEAVKESLVIFLAVPTPSDEDGSADLQHVLEAAGQVARAMNDYKVIVDKSTVPVGTAAKVKQVIAENTDHEFDVVSNPEFLKEGNAVDDFMKPDRVIIGCETKRAETIIHDLYEPFVRTGHPIISMKIESAELTKYTANAILATKISFINEIARLCELVGADVNEVRAGIGSDSRIGSAFIFPGMGFGGSCFPKDLRALNHTATETGLEMKVVRAVIEANKVQHEFIPQKILRHFNGNISGMKFAIWGLAFKAKTDDMRESPALSVIDMLLEHGAKVVTYDPEAMPTAQGMYGDRIEYVEDSYDALEGADALVIATEWNEFRNPDFDRIKDLLKNPVIFDGRNLYNLRDMQKAGFAYYGVGQA